MGDRFQTNVPVRKDWSIGCDLIDGRCARIGYSKRGEWTEAHILTVLNANAQGAKWTENSGNPSVGKMVRNWKRDDSAEAEWSFVNGMSVTTPAYNRAKAISGSEGQGEGERTGEDFDGNRLPYVVRYMGSLRRDR